MYIRKCMKNKTCIRFDRLLCFLSVMILCTFPISSRAVTRDTDLLVVDRIGRDINNDTYADSTLTVIYCVDSGDYSPDSTWGLGCASAYDPVFLTESGDFNGDGFGDLVIVERHGNDMDGDGFGDKGHLLVIDGALKDTVWDLEGPSDSGGLYLVKSGDFNNDGYDDLAVGRHYGRDLNTDGIYDDTEIKFYIGSVGGLSYWNDYMISPQNDTSAGYFSLESGDYNGDSYDDLVTLRHHGSDVNGDSIPDNAYLEIWSGGASGIGNSAYWSLHWWNGSRQGSGVYLMVTGNFNNDTNGDYEIDDLVLVRHDGADVGIPKDSILDGSLLRIYRGTINDSLYKIWELSGFPSGAGCYMIDAGDYDSDDYDDLTAIRYSGPDNNGDGISDDSYLRVFKSDSAHPDSFDGDVLWYISSPSGGNRFVLLKTGDFNGDYYDDIAVARLSASGKNTWLRIFGGNETITPESGSPTSDPGDWAIDGKWDGDSIKMGQILLEDLDNTIYLEEENHPRLLFTSDMIAPLRSRADWPTAKWDSLTAIADSLCADPTPWYQEFLPNDLFRLEKFESMIMILSFAYNFDTTASKNTYGAEAKRHIDTLIANWDIVKGHWFSPGPGGGPSTTKLTCLGMYVEALAIGYDWIFDKLDSSRKDTIEVILQECTDTIEVVNNICGHKWEYNNHAMWHTTPVLYAGIVLPRSLGNKYLQSMRSNIIDTIFYALEDMSENDGGWHEGPSYYMIVELPRVGQFCEAWRVAMHENLFTGDSISTPTNLADGFGFLQHAGEYISLFTTPDWLFMRAEDVGQTSAVFEDTDDGVGNITLSFRGFIGGYFLQLIANRCQTSNPDLAKYAQWYATTICGDLNHNLDSLNNVNHIYSLLWETDSVSATPPPHLTKHFAGIGNVVLRSDTTDDAVIVRFKCGDLYNNHNHHDQNSFTIYYKGNLAVDAGYYGKGGVEYQSEPETRFEGKTDDESIGWPNFHNLNYSWRTVAHNSILAFKDPKNSTIHHDAGDQVFKWQYGNQYADSLIDDGGQFFMNKNKQWPEDVGNAYFERGNILYLKDASSTPANNWFTVVRGDASNAYRNDNPGGINVLPTFKRDLGLIRPSDGDSECYVVVFDNVVYDPDTSSNAELSWLLNISGDASFQDTSSNPIFIKGPKRQFSEMTPDWPSQSHGGKYCGNMCLKRLYPSLDSSEIHLKLYYEVGSFESGYPQFDTSRSSNRIPGLLTKLHPYENHDIGGKRLEIMINSIGRRYFLNVLYPTEDTTGTGMAACDLVSSDKHLGSHIRSSSNRHIVFLFGKGDQSYDTTSYTISNHNNPTKHVVSDLANNSSFKVYYRENQSPFSNYLGQYASGDEGIIEFQCSSTAASVQFDINKVVAKGKLQERDSRYIGLFQFENIYPNPTTKTIIIRFMSPDKRRVTIKMYDVVGRVVEKMFDGKAHVGLNEIHFQNKYLASGVYFVRCETDEKVVTKKLVLQR